MKYFKDSYNKMIVDEDMVPTPQVKEKCGWNPVEEIYSTYQVVNNKVFKKMDLDTLMAIFYYDSNNY